MHGFSCLFCMLTVLFYKEPDAQLLSSGYDMIREH